MKPLIKTVERRNGKEVVDKHVGALVNPVLKRGVTKSLGVY